jgi:hypothetical protein
VVTGGNSFPSIETFIKPIFDSALPQLIERTRQSARRWRRGTTCSGLAIRR